ncbi:6605_t:CDS:10 [Paraglomus occultum]|uniref:asparaginase n=1 Tax=Paraglomus occultum TaxID=144539 RepID=A0A9N9C114_9GLOM|nr:6605_t:CDS:10 [Paraglomus occultum]
MAQPCSRYYYTPLSSEENTNLKRMRDMDDDIRKPQKRLLSPPPNMQSGYCSSEEDVGSVIQPVLHNDCVSMALGATQTDMAVADLSRVLIIYTGGTVGMKHTKSRGYIPVQHYLTRTLTQMPRFHDPRAYMKVGMDAVRTFGELEGERGEGFKNKISLTDKDTGKAGPVKFVDTLITPPSLYGKRIIYSIVEYEPLLDSCNMCIDDWVRITSDIEANYQYYEAFIILHGTDTMAYTASVLSFLLENLGKTVILTGSQVPISEVRNDAVENLLGALTIAGHFVIPEVCLFFNNKLFRGNRASKSNAVDFDAFESPNLRPLVTVGINIEVNWSDIMRPSVIAPFRAHKKLDCNVAALRLFPGITESTLRAFLADPIRGVVLETYGAGNAPDTRDDLMRCLAEASDRGVVVVNCTQCKKGLVSDLYATGKALAKVGVVPGSDMTPECALAKLSYLLGKGLSPDEVRKEIKRNLRGELTVLAETQRFTVHNYTHTLIQDIIKAASSKEGLDLPGRVLMESALYPVLLCSAAGLNDLDGLHLLVESAGRSLLLNCTDYDGRTPLHIACSAGHYEIVQFLLQNGASVHVRDRFNHTPLFEAAQHKHMRVVRLLRQAGAHFNDSETQDIIFQALVAATTDDVELLRHFIEAGLDVNCTGFDHRTALHHAVTEVRLSTVQYLLSIPNINTETKDRWGRTPLDDAEMNLGRAYGRDSERESAARDIVRMLRECAEEDANNRVGIMIDVGTGSAKGSLEGDSALGESP